MRKEIHQSKCEEWEKLIDQWISSGLSKKQWCNENNINIRQLRYWQHVLKREVTGSNDSDNSGGQGRDTNEPADTVPDAKPITAVTKLLPLPMGSGSSLWPRKGQEIVMVYTASATAQSYVSVLSAMACIRTV